MDLTKALAPKSDQLDFADLDGLPPQVYTITDVSENGTELNALLPKMSPLNPGYLTKKQSVFQKIAAFVEKFKGVGGQV